MACLLKERRSHLTLWFFEACFFFVPQTSRHRLNEGFLSLAQWQPYPMPLHIHDIAGLFHLWWKTRVDSTTQKAQALSESATYLSYWWPFLVWLNSMKVLILDDFPQYRQMYQIFRNRAHVKLMMQRGFDADTSLQPNTTRNARALVDCFDVTGFSPSQDQITKLLKCTLREVRWKECMLTASQLVPHIAVFKFIIEDLNNLAATCRLFNLRCTELVAAIQALLDRERPWAVFVHACPSIPKLHVQAVGTIWHLH